MGVPPSFLTDGDTFVDFGDEHEGRRGRALTAAATSRSPPPRVWGGGGGTVARAGSRRAAVPPKRPTDARVGASGARVEDSVEDSVAEDSGVVAGKKKRGARGKKRGSRGGAGVAPEADRIWAAKEETSSRAREDERENHDEPRVKRTSSHPCVRGATRVGRLEIGPAVLGYGSCGTVVFEGALDGRPVAVKRLLAHFHELARAELATLIASDEHPNILRCFAMEEDDDFVYVALERCERTLASLVTGGGSEENLRRADSPNDPPFAFVDRASGRPPRGAASDARRVRGGQRAARGGRRARPEAAERAGDAAAAGKLADMGLAKKLNAAEGTSFETRPVPPPFRRERARGEPADGGGTRGRLAPERLAGGRQSRAVDAFGWAA